MNVTPEDRRRLEPIGAWLGRRPPWTFHFMPTSASWLNAVEDFFAKLTRRRLHRAAPTSISRSPSTASWKKTNADPKPFIWTAYPIAAVERGKQALESIH